MDGVKGVTEVLHERGLDQDKIDRFRTDPDELYVLPLSRRPTEAAALRRPRRWRRIYRTMQIMSVVMIAGAFGSQYWESKSNQARIDELIERGTIDRAAYERAKTDHYEANWEERYIGNGEKVRLPVSGSNIKAVRVDQLNKAALHQVGTSTAFEWSAVLGVAGFLLLFPGPRAVLWFWPSRILLLRPFGTRDVSKGLKRFVRRNVIFSGHVFTLADQHMKESFLVFLWDCIPKSEIEIAALLLNLVRVVDSPRRRLYIKKARHYRHLTRRLAKRFLLNSFWVTSWDKIRKIRTTDPWWKRCIDLLSASCEIILVDLTVVKAGTLWELAKISNEEMTRKAIFIVQAENLDAAQSSLAQYWPPENMPHIFTYDAKGRMSKKLSLTGALPALLPLRDRSTAASLKTVHHVLRPCSRGSSRSSGRRWRCLFGAKPNAVKAGSAEKRSPLSFFC